MRYDDVGIAVTDDDAEELDAVRTVEFSTDVKCCDEDGVGFMLVVERAVPRSA